VLPSGQGMTDLVNGTNQSPQPRTPLLGQLVLKGVLLKPPWGSGGLDRLTCSRGGRRSPPPPYSCSLTKMSRASTGIQGLRHGRPDSAGASPPVRTSRHRHPARTLGSHGKGGGMLGPANTRPESRKGASVGSAKGGFASAKQDGNPTRDAADGKKAKNYREGSARVRLITWPGGASREGSLKPIPATFPRPSPQRSCPDAVTGVMVECASCPILLSTPKTSVGPAD
jgi:hypothetical protein